MTSIGAIWIIHMLNCLSEGRRTFSALLLAAGAIYSASLAHSFSDQGVDVTPDVERVGNPGQLSYPAQEHRFAGNIWDLKAFNGRIYVGLGNRNNSGPAPNAGPVDVWYFDPAAGKLVKDWTAPDEQVDIFRVIDGRLVIPGNDPQESWQLGNFYRLNQDGWQKVRTLPNGIHNFDMLQFDGVLYAALGTEYGAVVAQSKDGGQTWQEHRLERNVGSSIARAYGLCVVAGRLHVSALSAAGSSIFALSGNSFRSTRSSNFFPELHASDVIVRGCVDFGGNAVYLGAQMVLGEHAVPLKLFVASGSEHVRAIELPHDARPRDITVAGERVYALGSRRETSGFTTYVFETVDLAEWKELFHLATPTFARSIEVLNGDFYIGLGSLKDDVHPKTGDLLRVRAQSYGRQ